MRQTPRTPSAGAREESTHTRMPSATPARVGAVVVSSSRGMPPADGAAATAARRGVQQPPNPLTAQRAFVSARAIFTALACKADAEVGFWVVIRIFASSLFVVIVVNLTSRPARRAPRDGSARP